MSTGEQDKSANTPLCRLDAIEDGGARAVTVTAPKAMELVLLRRGDAVYAYHNLCSHQARPLDYLPGKFLLDQGCIVCAAHGSTFAIETGERRGGPAPSGLRAVPIRVHGGAVWLGSG